MALEAVVFPQDSFVHNNNDMFGLWSCEGVSGVVAAAEEEEQEQGEMMMMSYGSLSVVVDPCGSTTTTGAATIAEPVVGGGGRRKRRRAKSSCKNMEEVENQRMTHIAVERNRRKQMNEYLNVIRSLMPPSYIHKGDQASIIGGAINFVKELEQLLQSLEAQKRIKQRCNVPAATTTGSNESPFLGFFSFPQYSSSDAMNNNARCSSREATAENRSSTADIEVTMVENHANIKVLSRRWPKQLLKMVVGLHSMRLTTLHLNVTTVDDIALYSFSLKVEDDSRLTSVDEIATAAHHMMERIHEEAGVA